MRDLLKVFNDRYKLAKDWTNDAIEEDQRALDDYKCKKGGERDNSVHDRHLTKSRYSYRVPYIFVTHESMLSSLFEKPPELIFTGKGQLDDDKRKAVEFSYKYLYDKLNLDEFLEQCGWWFLLIGYVSSYQDYKIEIKEEVPLLDEAGVPQFDEEGQPIMTPVYGYHDPVIFVDNPLKTYFAPGSEFSSDGSKIPYLVREKNMDVDEVYELYEIDVEADEEVETKNSKKMTEEEKADIKKAKVMFYSGKLPKEIQKELAKNHKIQWTYNAEYYAVFTMKKILYIKEKAKNCTLSRFYSDQNEFFGFGLAHTLRDTQREMSTRRGQQIRYADLYAYPWLAVDGQTKVDHKSLMDVQKRTPLIYTSQKPEYIIPPTMPDTIIKADEMARSDAQFISGTLDLSKGAQDTNTVETATGQQMFARDADKRTQKARKSIARMYKHSVINLLEQARDNWEDGKLITITDESGEQVEMNYNPETLQGIDFDTDIDFSIDSINENQQIIAEREIALYAKAKDDPYFNQRKIREGMLRNGFKKKNPTEYMATEEEMAMQQQPLAPEEQMDGIAANGGYENPIPDMGGDTTSLPLLGNELAPRPA